MASCMKTSRNHNAYTFIDFSFLQIVFLLRETPSDGRTHTKFNRDASVSSMTVDELSAGRQYQFWVTAVTGVGEGKSSNVVSQTPADRGEELVGFGSFQI